MNYSFLRSMLFRLDAERAHQIALAMLDLCAQIGWQPFPGNTSQCPRRIMGIEFPNPVGLAAGLDKNGDHIDALAGLGFGFLEIGTVTPRAQPGNPQPRLFRLERREALINRMGFNNRGVDHLIQQVARARYRGILGINIGKNFDTPFERAVDDYRFCLCKIYPFASYVVVNISSPNTADLRRLQGFDALDKLLSILKADQRVLAAQHGKNVPLMVKISPDLDKSQIDDVTTALLRHGIDGVIATNTSTARPAMDQDRESSQAGGLSGVPLHALALRIIRQLRARLGSDFPIIGVGGIASAEDARAMTAAGANLVQLYTGLIYRGPSLISATVNALCKTA